jgi:hypothetical protein
MSEALLAIAHIEQAARIEEFAIVGELLDFVKEDDARIVEMVGVFTPIRFVQVQVAVPSSIEPGRVW